MDSQKEPSISPLTLLTLPPEIRAQILTLLLSPAPTSTSIPHIPSRHPPNNPKLLTISPLFIREHFTSRFMTQTPAPKQIYVQVLRVNRQLSEECLPILYALPLWRASCRLEALASQVGARNFGRIRRMEIDLDDLDVILGSLRADIQAESGKGFKSLAQQQQSRLMFNFLERLDVEGWQRYALTNLGDRASRLEARRLCELAREILLIHPVLGILVQIDDGRGGGGADARDLSMGRVKWRFLRNERDMLPDVEHIVNLNEMIELFDEILETDQVPVRPPNAGSWHGGVYVQYPYLSQA